MLFQGSRLTFFTRSAVAPGAQAENLGAHLKSAGNAIIQISQNNDNTDKFFNNKET